jgi:hemerythrin-like domain-containing protein
MDRFSSEVALRKVNSNEQDAIACLTREHNVMRRLFRSYDHLASSGGDNEKKSETVGQICFKWCVHIQIEEELFYPAAKVLTGVDEQLMHALLDHAGSRELVAMLDEMEPGDANFDSSVAVLAAYVLPHIDEEEEVIFPRLRELGMEMTLLGQAIAQRQIMLSGNATPARSPRPHRRAHGVAASLPEHTLT